MACARVVLLTIVGAIIPIYGQSEMGSPCPHLFKYKIRYDSYKYGVLTIPSPSHHESTVTVIALFTLRSKLPTKYGGLMELFGTRDETIRDLQEHRPIRFLIHFPIQSPMPKLKLISYNNFLICGSTEIDMFMMRRPMINIEFRYTFNTTGLVDSMELEIERDDMESYQRDQQQSLKTAPTTITTTTASPDPECGRVHYKFQMSPLIAGGESVKCGSWPWLVAIYITKPTGPTFICAGNLLSPKAIVTSAYCFRTPDTEHRSNEVLIYLGRHDMTNWIEEGSVMRRVSSIHIPSAHHHNMLYENHADIAIVVLESSVEFSEYIQPICLWDGPVDELVGKSGIVVGWGSDRNGMAVTDTPHGISLPIVANSECIASNERFRTILTNGTFCAGSRDGKGPCHGDSGGGIAIAREGRMVLRGLVSAALAGPLNTCDLSNYVVFTDLAQYRDWIQTFL